MLAVVRAAFAARPPLDPPAAALGRDRRSRSPTGSRAHGGLLAAPRRRAGRRAGARPDRQHDVPPPLRRAARRAQGHGVAARADRGGGRGAPTGFDDLTVVAREELPATVGFWERHGLPRDPPRLAVRRAAPAAPHLPVRRARRRRDARPRPARSPGSCAPATWSCSRRARRRQDDVHPGSRRRARRARRRHLADVRDRPGAPLAGRRPGAGARRRLPARRHRRARRPRPRHLARRGGHGRRVGRGDRRGAGGVAARGPDRPGARPPRRARRPRPAPGADDAGRAALARAGGPRQPPPAAGREAQREPPASTSAAATRPTSTTLDPSIPLPPWRWWCAEHDGRVLLVHNAWRDEWELPRGAHRRTASRPREAAVRDVPRGDRLRARARSCSSASRPCSSATSGGSSASPSTAAALHEVGARSRPRAASRRPRLVGRRSATTSASRRSTRTWPGWLSARHERPARLASAPCCSPSTPPPRRHRRPPRRRRRRRRADLRADR